MNLDCMEPGSNCLFMETACQQPHSGILVRAQPGEGTRKFGVRRIARGLLHHVGGERGGVGVAALGARRVRVCLERAQRVRGPTAVGLLLLPDLIDNGGRAAAGSASGKRVDAQSSIRRLCKGCVACSRCR